MTERLQLNGAIYNPYAVETLEQSHPALYVTLSRWFAAVNNFEEQPMVSVISARSPDEVERHRSAAADTLGKLPQFLQVLDELVVALDAALAAEPAGSDQHTLFTSLAEAARHNRSEFIRVSELVAQILDGETRDQASPVEAERAVRAAAARLEALAERAADRAGSFGELRLLIDEWRQVWTDLDAALRGLTHQDERRLRQVEQGRMRAATEKFLTHLLAAKQRARETGGLAPGEITSHGDSVADRFAVAILRGAYPDAVALLAPWLQAQWSAASLREKVVTLCERACGGVSDPEGEVIQLTAREYHLGKNPLSLAELKRIPSRPGGWGEIPSEVTEENYLGWVLLDLMTDEEDSFLTNVENLVQGYLIPVRTAVGERIGFVFLGEA